MAREVLFGDGAIPVSAQAVTTDATEDLPAGSSPMAQRVRGELGAVSIRTIQRLAGSMRLEPPETRTPMGAQIPFRVRMIARDGSARWVDVVRTCTGLGWLRSTSDQGSERLIRITAPALDGLLEEVTGYRGDLAPQTVATARGVVEALECPYEHSDFTLDARTLRQRIYGNSRAPGSGGAKVNLTEERFLARAPRGYDARNPAGLLVWVSAGELGEIPEAFFPALDELGIVAISAENSGNTRAVNDRIQLALDGAATAQARYHIDPRRVYVAGISGGAKIASMTWACFPDVFSGAVSIVGLASYKDTPAGSEGVWPALFAKPGGAMFRLLSAQRLAVISGPPDFNYRSIVPMAEAMSRDGLEIRVFDYPDMAHTLPTPERFSEAIFWIDEGYRDIRSKESQRAQQLLAEYMATASRTGGPDERAIQSLNAVMEAGPWSPAAWKAVESLRMGATSAATTSSSGP